MNTEWIPVENGLPEIKNDWESERVLVVARGVVMIAKLASWNDGEWVVEDDQNWPGDSVTHWMPIPELPIPELP